MKFTLFLSISILFIVSACSPKISSDSPMTKSSGKEKMVNLFNSDLSNASFPEGVWKMEKGELTATEDQCIWSNRMYDNFVIDLEFKNAAGTNSGVIFYCTDRENWIPNSVEVQIADDYAKKWAESPKDWQCGAIFGHLPANQQKIVKQPGEWNHMMINCIDQNIKVQLNGQAVTEMDMSLWTSATKNPDGSPIPSWLSKPFASLPTKGYIGFQGKHAGAPIWFRNIRIMELN